MHDCVYDIVYVVHLVICDIHVCSNVLECLLHSNALSGFVQNVSSYPRVVRVFPENRVTHIYGFHQPLGFQIVER